MSRSLPIPTVVAGFPRRRPGASVTGSLNPAARALRGETIQGEK